MKKRLCAIVLVIALLIPCVPAVGAIPALPAAGGVLATVQSVVTNPAFAAGASTVVSNAVSNYQGEYVADMEDLTNKVYNCLVSIIGYGRMTYSTLEQKCRILNSLSQDFLTVWPYFYQTGVSQGLWEDDMYGKQAAAAFYQYSYFCELGDELAPWRIWEINDGVYVLYNPSIDFVFADTTGRYPYSDGMENIWRPFDDVASENVVFTVTDYGLETTLQNMRSVDPTVNCYIGGMTFDNGLSYDVIYANGILEETTAVLCDASGAAFASPNFAIQAGGDRDYNDDVPDQPAVTDEPITDIYDFIIQTFPDGTFTWIDGCDFEYSEDNRTYYIDASSSYDIDNNYYYNYEWNYEYHIDYTSITYIGQTAEYDKYYEYYYDLPDGRSSADLTAAELEVLNTRIDVLEYARSTDDVSVRALYHFDGNTFDSSYWSQSGDFVWSEGASITYMDAGVFGGALYLSENPHAFSVNLPSNLGSGDWTIQFRYYQSATPAPVNDSAVTIGGSALLRFNGSSILNSGGTALSPITAGVWNEICLMRSGNTVVYFLNGVNVGSVSLTSVLSNVINFQFGSGQQTYKYFDELRVTNKALYPASGYTPSSVPFDTNLTLVLPDSQLPVADAYWKFESSKENLLSPYQLDNFVDFYSGYVYSTSSSPSYTSRKGSNNMLLDFRTSDEYCAFYNSYLTPFTTSSSGSYFSAIDRSNSYFNISSNSALTYVDQSSSYYQSYSPPYSFQIYGYNVWADYNSITLFSPNTTYTFSMVSSSGEVGSITFTTPNYLSSDDYKASYSLKTVSFNGYSLFYAVGSYDGYLRYLSCGIRPLFYGSGGEFVYLELVEGSSTDLTAEYIESVVVMDKDDLNTPSLAVRTQVDITGYQLGGVRPSLPTEGLVWALVESGRITSLQIYNGQAWEECDGRIWTGERWVPYYAYDVILLKDLWDVNGTDPTLDPIYTETGFWTWLQSAWKDMIARLDALISKPSGGGDINVDTDILPLFPPSGVVPGEDDDGWTIIDLAITLKDGAWILVTGVVNVVSDGIGTLQEGVESITGFFEAFDPNIPGGVFDILNMEDVDIWA